MRLTQKIGILGLFSVISLAAAILWPQHTYADSYVDSQGATQNINGGDFKLQDPFTIVGPGGIKYTNASTPCGNDSMYQCDDGVDPFHTGAYWFWPNGSVLAKAGGQCVSGIVLQILHQGGSGGGQNSTGLAQSNMYMVRFDKDQGGNCILKDKYNNVINTSNNTADFTGWGYAATSGGNGLDEHYVVPQSGNNNRINVSYVTSLGTSKAQFYAGSTEFSWVDSGTILAIASGHKLTKVDPNSDVFKQLQGSMTSGNNTDKYKTGYDYYTDVGNCVGDKGKILALLAVGSDKSTVHILHRNGGNEDANFKDDSWQGDQQECLIGHNHSTSPARMWGGSISDTAIGIGAVQNAQAEVGAGDGTGAGISGTSTDTSSGPTVNCSVSIINPLSWVLCPAAIALQNVASGLESAIVSYLNVDTDQLAAYKPAWDVVRSISLGLIVIAGLVAVISQGMGIEILDAYTLRKTLPRLLIAAIGLTLSWPLIIFFVGLTNDLGNGVRSLIYAPFRDSGFDTVYLGGGTTAVLGLMAAPGIALLGYVGLLSFAATGALAAAVAFLVLILRQMIIVFLLIFAPLAIIAYTLPNTQKVWKLWWDSFSKALLMFPIISGFIAIGHVFAAVSSKNAGTINQIIAFTAYFAPYFLLPATFRLAGGALATVGGFANDRSRGLFDRLSKGRQTRMADRMGKLKNNSLWDNNSKVGRVANKIGGAAFDPVGNAAYYGRNRVPGLRKYGNKIASHLGHEQIDQSKKLLEEMNGTFNDKAYRAMNGGLHQGLSQNTQAALRSEGLLGKSPTNLQDIQKIAHIMRNSEEQTERLAGGAIEGMSGRLATLYQDPEMSRANVAAAGMMGLAAHGFLNRKDMQPATDAVMQQGGAELAQAAGLQSQLYVAKSRPDLKAGYGMDWDPNFDNGPGRQKGGYVDGLKTNDNLRGLEMFSTLGAGDIAGAKGGFFKSEAEGGSGEIMSYILANGKEDQANATNAEIAQKLDGMSPDQQKAQRAQWKKTSEGRELLKRELAAKQYTSLVKVLRQNAGDYSHGSVDVQIESEKLLSGQGIPIVPERDNTPTAIRAEQQQSQQGGPQPGGPPPPPPGGIPPTGLNR